MTDQIDKVIERLAKRIWDTDVPDYPEILEILTPISRVLTAAHAVDAGRFSMACGVVHVPDPKREDFTDYVPKTSLDALRKALADLEEQKSE